MHKVCSVKRRSSVPVSLTNSKSQCDWHRHTWAGPRIVEGSFSKNTKFTWVNRRVTRCRRHLALVYAIYPYDRLSHMYGTSGLRLC